MIKFLNSILAPRLLPPVIRKESDGKTYLYIHRYTKTQQWFTDRVTRTGSMPSAPNMIFTNVYLSRPQNAHWPHIVKRWEYLLLKPLCMLNDKLIWNYIEKKENITEANQTSAKGIT